MNEGTISTETAIAIGAWVVVAGLMISAWCVLLIHPDALEVGIMLAATSCASSAAAAVCSIRCCMRRTRAMIRASIQRTETAALQAVR